MSDLDCYRVRCGGTLEYCGNTDSNVLYRCSECGDEWDRGLVERYAGESNPVGKLCQVLLDWRECEGQ